MADSAGPADLDSPADWDELAEPWRVAYQQAWESWCAGSYGIGACLADPGDGSIVAVGRNRITEGRDVPGVLAGNFLAHAEMNTFAVLSPINARGLHLYTTLEPCIMCAASAILMNVEHIHYAADDEYFAGLDDLWTQHAYTAERRPTRSGPFSGPLSAFGRMLPISVQIFWVGKDHPPMRAARRAWPELFELAAALPQRAELRALADAGAPVEHALDLLWSDLCAAAPQAVPGRADRASR